MATIYFNQHSIYVKESIEEIAEKIENSEVNTIFLTSESKIYNDCNVLCDHQIKRIIVWIDKINFIQS